MDKTISIKINDKFITLGQFLKLADLISSGGESKYYLANKEVKINGEIDNRRGRKLYINDVIETNNNKYKIC